MQKFFPKETREISWEEEDLKTAYNRGDIIND